MKQFIKMIRLDIAEMGLLFYIPIVFVFLITAYGLYFYGADPSEKTTVILLEFYQNVVPPLGAWWILILFHRYVEEEGNEAFFSYGYSTGKIGIGRTVFFLGIFLMILMMSLTCWFFAGVADMGTLTVVLIALAVQSVFYGSIGFLSTIVIKSIIWGTTVVLIITTLNIWGNIPVISRVLSLKIQMRSGMSPAELPPKLVFIMLITMVLLYRAQKLFNCLGERKYG